MYLGFVPLLEDWHIEGRSSECSIMIEKGANWLTDFVELDLERQQELHYCQLYCGIIRGALEMVNLQIYVILGCICVC